MARKVTIGEKVQMFRASRGLSQGKLARKAGMERTHLLRIEADKVIPGAVTLAKLAKALGTTPSALLLGWRG